MLRVQDQMHPERHGSREKANVTRGQTSKIRERAAVQQRAIDCKGRSGQL